MLSFLFLVLPLSLVIYYLWNVKSSDSENNSVNKRFFVPMLIGVLLAVLLCAIKVFFTYSHRVVPSTFTENFAYFFLNQSCVPLCAVFVIYCLIMRGPFVDKVTDFFPLTASFYAVYLQYLVISGTVFVYSGYAIFVKPLVYLAMLLQCALSIRCFLGGFCLKKVVFVVINITIMVAYVTVPAILEAFYAINTNFTAIIIISAIYILFPVGHALFLFIKNLFSK